jgi:periplasmic protein TonB
MTAAAHAGPPTPERVATRWIISLGLVVLIHGAGAWLLLRPAPMLPPDPSPPAVIVDLAPPEPAPEAAPAPEQTPPPAASEPPSAEAPATPAGTPPPDPVAQAPVTPDPIQDPPPPQEKAPEAIAPEAVLEQPPVPPVPPRPVEAAKPVLPKPVPAKTRPAPQTAKTAPAQAHPADAVPANTAAASPSAAAVAAATTSWQGRLQAYLARFKQYPTEARMRHHEGTPIVRFTMTRTGKVLSYRLENGCGHELLDKEAVALIERAQPMPPLPDEMPQATIELVLPVRFQLH